MCQYAIVQFKPIAPATQNGGNLLFEWYFGKHDVGLGVVIKNKKPKIGKGTRVDIGKRLQALRKAHGLSQRELASRAGLTNGTISLIEQNKTSPSVASLKSLLDAIPMSIAEFFANIEQEQQATYFYAADEFIEIAPQSDGPTVSLRQLGQASHHALQILDEAYPPNADTGPELLSHIGEEAGIVTQGEIEITVADQVKVLRVGEGYLFDSQLPHRFRNVSDSMCRIISACTPPTF